MTGRRYDGLTQAYGNPGRPVYIIGHQMAAVLKKHPVDDGYPCEVILVSGDKIMVKERYEYVVEWLTTYSGRPLIEARFPERRSFEDEI